MNVNGLVGRVAKLEKRYPAAVSLRVDHLREWLSIFDEVRTDIHSGELYEHIHCGYYQGCHHWPRYHTKYPKKGYCDTSTDPLRQVKELILSDWGYEVMGWTVPPCDKALPGPMAHLDDYSILGRRGRLRIDYILSCLDQLQAAVRDELAFLSNV